MNTSNETSLQARAEFVHVDSIRLGTGTTIKTPKSKRNNVVINWAGALEYLRISVTTGILKGLLKSVKWTAVLGKGTTHCKWRILRPNGKFELNRLRVGRQDIDEHWSCTTVQNKVQDTPVTRTIRDPAFVSCGTGGWHLLTKLFSGQPIKKNSFHFMVFSMPATPCACCMVLHGVARCSNFFCLLSLESSAQAVECVGLPSNEALPIHPVGRKLQSVSNAAWHCGQWDQSHMLHAWYIFLHLGDF